MKKTIKAFVSSFVMLALVVMYMFTFNVSAYSFEEAMEDYKKAYDDESELDEIKNNGNEKRSGKPFLTYEEYMLYKHVDEQAFEKRAASTTPSVKLLDTIGEVPFASNSRGASCDKRIVFFDFYRQKYYAIEYNSYYGDIFITPDYGSSDGYYFWIWFRLYYTDNATHQIFNRIGSSWYGNSVTAELGTSSTGDSLWVFYLYSFSKPTDYNSSAEVSFGDSFGSISRGQDTSVSTAFKNGQYYYQVRFRIMPIFVDDSNSSTSAVIAGHNICPVGAGLFLYTDDTLKVVNLSGSIQNQSIDHFGNITGSVTVNSHNIYTEYSNYVVNNYNYWLMANFVKNYSITANATGDYGIFQGIYDIVFSRFDYFADEVMPAAISEVETFVSEQRIRFNSLFQPFVSDIGQSPFWIFSIVLALVAVFLAVRVIMYFIAW